jgi:nicotinate-nucleotide adenylyltransferase
MAAQDAFERQGLDRLFFVPAARAPLKEGGECAPVEDRLAMLREAVDGDRRFEIADLEAKRGGTSYTVETARLLRGLFPADRLFWILGGDRLPMLTRWKDVAELAGIVEFIVLERPGFPAGSDPVVPGLRLHRCPGHLLEISSTEIRGRIRRGMPLDFFMPRKTIVYIRDKGLYRTDG